MTKRIWKLYKEELKPIDVSKYTITESGNVIKDTKDKLKQEAEKYVKQNYCEICVMADDCKCGCIDCFTVQAYLASAEPREKRIAELEQKLENIRYYLDNEIPLEFINEATTIIYKMV